MISYSLRKYKEKFSVLRKVLAELRRKKIYAQPSALDIDFCGCFDIIKNRLSKKDLEGAVFWSDQAETELRSSGLLRLSIISKNELDIEITTNAGNTKENRQKIYKKLVELLVKYKLKFHWNNCGCGTVAVYLCDNITAHLADIVDRCVCKPQYSQIP